MSNLVFLSGDFCSGSTLLFTLFRATGHYHCLYEPLHPRLREYLIWPLRAYEHHYFVTDYFKEYAGFDRIDEVFDESWATRNLYLTADSSADDLYRYLNYLIGTAFGRQPRVLLKFNRMNFRLSWLRANFPHAKIVHVYRDKESEWKSIVRRGQEHLKREDIGQHSPAFDGFHVATWCEDLKSTFPELAACNSTTGFERFSKLYDASLASQRAHADISIEYRTLCREFETECQRMFDAVGCLAAIGPLKPLVIPPEKQQRSPLAAGSGLGLQAGDLVHRFGRHYARLKLSLSDRRRERVSRGA